MMTRLMIWFIELQNRFNESRLFKILMIYVLNQIDDLTSWQQLLSSRLSFCKMMKKNKIRWERIEDEDWNETRIDVNAF